MNIQYKNNLPSFTMLELITVLTISTIIISIAYVAYEMIYKDFSDYKNDVTNTLTTMNFITVLERDINLCDSFQLDTYDFKVFQKNTTVQYDFNEQTTTRYLVDNLEVADTFQIKINNFTIENRQLFLDYTINQPQYESSIYTLNIHL